MTAAVLLDTCVLSDLLNRRVPELRYDHLVKTVEHLQNAGWQLAVNDLICAELVALIPRNTLERLLKNAYITILPHSLEDAWQGGMLRSQTVAQSRKPMRGRRHLMDFIIAAQARRLGALVTADADYEIIATVAKLKIVWV